MATSNSIPYRLLRAGIGVFCLSGLTQSHVRVQYFGHNHPFPSSNPPKETRRYTTLCDTLFCTISFENMLLLVVTYLVTILVPRNKIFSAPPPQFPNSPQTTSRPLGPSPSSRPPSWDFQLKIEPPSLPGASDSPFPPPRAGKN